MNVPPGNGIQRVVPVCATDGTPLGAAPYEAVFLPQDTQQLDTAVRPTAAAATTVAGAGDVPVVQPVALVDLPSGNIVVVGEGRTKDSNGTVRSRTQGTRPTVAPNAAPAACAAGRRRAGSARGAGGARRRRRSRRGHRRPGTAADVDRHHAAGRSRLRLVRERGRRSSRSALSPTALTATPQNAASR